MKRFAALILLVLLDFESAIAQTPESIKYVDLMTFALNERESITSWDVQFTLTVDMFSKANQPGFPESISQTVRTGQCKVDFVLGQCLLVQQELKEVYVEDQVIQDFSPSPEIWLYSNGKLFHSYAGSSAGILGDASRLKVNAMEEVLPFDVRVWGYALQGDMARKIPFPTMVANNSKIYGGLTLPVSPQKIAGGDVGPMGLEVDMRRGFWPTKRTLRGYDGKIIDSFDASLTKINGQWLPESVVFTTPSTRSQFEFNWKSVNQEISQDFFDAGLVSKKYLRELEILKFEG